MSMSEFEHWLQDEGRDDVSPLVTRESGLPDDFTADDLAFARELESLLAPEKELIPPYYIQTLLESEDERFRAVPHGFEQKTRAQVLRQLRLPRNLFGARRPLLKELTYAFPSQRPFVAIIAACLMFILAALMTTGPSFASGLQFLLSGAHSGVVLVKSYPSSLASASAPKAQASDDTSQNKLISLLEAQAQLHFSMYWPHSMPMHYILNTISLYQDPSYTWADGPVLELDFDYTARGVAPRGTGQIAICEFKPVDKVFQVVQLGAAHKIQIDPQGRASALYIDGQWVKINKSSHDWAYGGRSELIYEHDGVIFWIVGDQRDGIDSGELLDIANSLNVFNVRHALHAIDSVHAIEQKNSDGAWLFAGDVVYTDSPSGPLLSIIGTDVSSTNDYHDNNQIHSH
jgi:hypothetical protein